MNTDDPVYADRLRKLADKLDTVPLEQFDIRSWSRETECGTSACAVGWAATIPEFVEAGLSLRADPIVPTVKSPQYLNGGLFLGWAAVMVFFGLPPREADYLFSFREYGYNPHPSSVAERIRSFLNDRKV